MNSSLGGRLSTINVIPKIITAINEIKDVNTIACETSSTNFNLGFLLGSELFVIFWPILYIKAKILIMNGIEIDMMSIKLSITLPFKIKLKGDSIIAIAIINGMR